MSKEINDSLSDRGIVANKTNKVKSLQFQLDQALPAHSAGAVVYDPASKSFVLDTGFADVRANVPFETLLLVYNATASDIVNGDPVSVNLTFTGAIPNVMPMNSASIDLTLGFAGVAIWISRKIRWEW